MESLENLEQQYKLQVKVIIISDRTNDSLVAHGSEQACGVSGRWVTKQEYRVADAGEGLPRHHRRNLLRTYLIRF